MLKKKSGETFFDADDDYKKISLMASGEFSVFYLAVWEVVFYKAKLRFEQFISQKVSAQKVCALCIYEVVP